MSLLQDNSLGHDSALHNKHPLGQINEFRSLLDSCEDIIVETGCAEERSPWTGAILQDEVICQRAVLT